MLQRVVINSMHGLQLYSEQLGTYRGEENIVHSSGAMLGKAIHV